ncbi:MAG: tetratricopeptide repeat protein [Polyangiaceae bacterium]
MSVRRVFGVWIGIAIAIAGCASSSASDVDIPAGATADAAPGSANAPAPRRPRKPRTSDVPPPPAHTATAEDRARAGALFDEGRALLTAGRIPEACAAFAESDALDPAPGTELNLGVCYEKLSDSERACHAFKAALDRVQDQPERRKFVEEHRAKLNCFD